MSDQTTYALHKMSWPEVAKAAETVELVLIPIGSTEQHGPNLGLGQDHVIANAYCERAAERLAPRLLALPAIPWGISDHHMNFPGTMTLRPETFLDLLEDIIVSMRHHGFRRFLIVNGHGGNQAHSCPSPCRTSASAWTSTSSAASATTPSATTPGSRPVAGEIPGGHACEMESSHDYYLAPDLIREETLSLGTLDEAFMAMLEPLTDLELEWPNAFNAHAPSGAKGDARKGTREVGQSLIESSIDELAEILDHLRHSPRWNGPPHGQVHVSKQR